jgi:chitodextrinase
MHTRYAYLLALLFFAVPNFAQIPVDAAGWSVITPSADSRIIYVSSSEGSDDNDGLSPENPVATLLKARNLARPGMPDHILLKTGDTFPTRFGISSFHSGRSASEPTVVAYYGESDQRPIVECEGNFWGVFNKARSYVAIVGLDIYAANQDPNSDQFDPDVFHGSRTALNLIGFRGGDILIEDCRFRYIGLGAFTAMEPGDLKNITIRRNIVVDAWADSTYFFHYSDGRNRQQGMYIEDTEGVLIEENLFDHNGWNAEVPAAGKNKFNHNIYMQVNNPNSDEIRVRGNIIARASAHGIQMRSGGRATDNLFVQNSVNLNVGYPPRPPVDLSATGYVAENVFLEVVRMDSTEENVNNPQRSGALWGVNTINLPAEVDDNIFAHALNTETNVRAVGEYDDVHDLGGSLEEEGNIVYRWFSKTEEPDPAWYDPNRMLGDYSRRLGLPATTAAFLERARERPLRTWWEEYSAYAVNDYIRTGFATDLEDTVAPPAPDTAYTIAVTGETATIGWSWAMDDVRTVGYNIYLNGELVTDSPVDADSFFLTGLSAMTAYTVAVRTVDVGNNESAAAAEVSFTTAEIDATAPSAPASPALIARTESSLRFSWEASSDNIGVKGYLIYLDGEQVNAEPIDELEYTVTDLAMARAYSLTVSAVDFAGNESEPSTPLRVKTVDPIRPTDPTDVQAFITAERTIEVSWGPSTDNDTLLGYNVYVNYATGDDPVAFTEDTTVVIELDEAPPYSVRVAALDVNGNRSRITQPVTAEPLTSLSANDGGVDLRVFPNPGDDHLNVSLQGVTLDRVMLYSATGQLVAERQLHRVESARLPTGGLPTGAYVVVIELTDGRRLTRQVSIRH